MYTNEALIHWVWAAAFAAGLLPGGAILVRV